MRLILHPVFCVAFAACSGLGNQTRVKKLEQVVARNAVRTTLDHLNDLLPKNAIFYAGTGASSFATGSEVRIVRHEVKYTGVEVEKKTRRKLYVVHARVLLEQEQKREFLRIKYTYLPDLKKRRKVRMQFAHGFPKERDLTRNDPLKEFRETPWLESILKKKLRKGMPEKALVLSWGQPLSVQSSISATGNKKVYGYGRRSVTLEDGVVTSWTHQK